MKRSENIHEEPKVVLRDITPMYADSRLTLPFADAGIPAGFPSPAQDYINEAIDLNREIVKHQETTFYARVVGDSMHDAGIFDGDLLVIDKSLDPCDGNVVVACIDGEFTVKRYHIDRRRRQAWLLPANKAYQPIALSDYEDVVIWGVVTHTIKKLV